MDRLLQKMPLAIVAGTDLLCTACTSGTLCCESSEPGWDAEAGRLGPTELGQLRHGDSGMLHGELWGPKGSEQGAVISSLLQNSGPKSAGQTGALPCFLPPGSPERGDVPVETGTCPRSPELERCGQGRGGSLRLRRGMDQQSALRDGGNCSLSLRKAEELLARTPSSYPMLTWTVSQRVDEGRRPRAGGGLEEGAQDRQSPERALHLGPLDSWGPRVWEQLSARSAACGGTREAGPDQPSPSPPPEPPSPAPLITAVHAH
ncbi:unnamed protein product [Rangifer tarandus platyrhynchus]|uniref:Uncharacterized protein n=1 Tax=Rangifer tarandus platyrhynchus TaxID=3082113 RepID=A0AC59YP51_RANTA